jgi:hypothetical protein
MLQELAASTGAQAWAISAMLFFIALFAAVALRVHRTPKRVHAEHARLPFEDADGSPTAQGACRPTDADRRSVSPPAGEGRGERDTVRAANQGAE